MLKSLANVFEPDPRFMNLVVGTSTGFRLMTLADHHAEIAAIVLEPPVPTTVRDAFDRARNTYLYAWCVYELTAVAEAQGYGALELALRLRLGPRKDGKRRSGLAELWTEATGSGLFNGLPTPSAHHDAEAYLRLLSERVRVFRNELAHGTDYLNIPGAALDALRDCASVINHLFRA